MFPQSNEEANSLKHQVSTLHQELEESRSKLTAAQEAKDQLTAQLSGNVISLNQQLEEVREKHRTEVKAKEELHKQVREELILQM